MPRGVTERYRGPGDLPQVLPLFPLRGAILLPRATLRVIAGGDHDLVQTRAQEVTPLIAAHLAGLSA